jgi:hypothetical protein
MRLGFFLYSTKEHSPCCTVHILITAVLIVLFSSRYLAQAQTFDSGSTGADGALNLTTPGTVIFDPASFPSPLDPEGDNIYHFTTITIGAGVTVRLTARRVNAPVFWLASGAAQIDGSIDLNGEDGPNLASSSVGRLPSLPGSGGYGGGIGGNKTSPAQPGGGPGGGAVNFPGQFQLGANGSGGARTATAFLIPLIGGSGGAGGQLAGDVPPFGASGGAGGGALLIASSVSITVNGTIVADGGKGGVGASPGVNIGFGGGGSGGAIRLAAPIISGTGTLRTQGGTAPSSGDAGGIRLEAFQRNFTGSTNPPHVVASPFGLFLPTASSGSSSIRAVKVNGIPVPPNPTGSFEMPDVTINETAAVIVEIEARNIPPGTIVQLYVFSENGPDPDKVINSTPLDGTLTQSTATATVMLPPGFVRAAWTPQ